MDFSSRFIGVLLSFILFCVPAEAQDLPAGDAPPETEATANSGDIPESSEAGETPQTAETLPPPAEPDVAKTPAPITGLSKDSEKIEPKPESGQKDKNEKPGFFDVPPRERPPIVEKDGLIFDIGIDYEFRNIYINPLELNAKDTKETFYGMQRARTFWTFGYRDKVKINAQIDLLDGVLFGDNGLLVGESPYPNEGTVSTAKSPNTAGTAVVLKKDGDPHSSESYTLGLEPIEPVKITRVWGEVNLMACLLRAGRMPAYEGRGILQNDGTNDDNRFGTSGPGDTVDRILLGTKPIQVIKAIIARDPNAADSRQDRGLVVGFAYDQLVEDQVQYKGDDAHQFGVMVSYKLPEFHLGKVPGRDLKAALSYAYRMSERVKLKLNALMLDFSIGIEHFFFQYQFGMLVGQTREISDAQSEFRLDTDPVVQDVLSYGMIAMADYRVGPVTFTMEFDMATGDDNPRHDSTLEHFYFAEGTKVGLLLFPHILAYETAKSAAATEAFLKDVGSTSLPSTQIDTGGAFTNAIAAFPQITWDIIPELFIRGGALFAWSEKPVVDPYETLHFWDGADWRDDRRNYNGGKDGRYYGTELDLRIGAKLWKEHFLFDLEGALLFPGSALQDINGDAAMSGLIEARFTFRI